MSDDAQAAPASTGESGHGHGFPEEDRQGCGRRITICKTCAESGEPMSFSHALVLLKEFPNMRVTRTGWNGKGQYIELQAPDGKSKMSLPYIYISTVESLDVPWVASQTDLLAEDWIKLPEEPAGE